MGAAARPQSEGPWVLVLDVGSSSARVWLYDRAGVGLDPGRDATQEYAWRTTPAGAMTCDADALFARVAAALDAGLACARETGLTVGAVAVTTFWHSVLGLDAAGEPLTPVYAWGDTRAAAEALRLAGEVDERALHRRTGCFLHPSYPSVKLAALRRADPGAFARVAAWVSFAELLEWRLFGERRCSISIASGTGLLDLHRLRWDPEALALAGVEPAQLSPLVDSDAPLRGLRPEFASRWPELAEVPWFPALGDGACANLGSGALGRESLGLTVGTSAAVRVLWEPEPEAEVQVPERLWCYRLDARRWVAGGALSNGGNAIAYLQRHLRLPPEREWERELEAMEPDAHGLTVLPFLVGERGPGWLGQQSATVAGLTLATPPLHLLRAWMEALAYRLAEAVERLDVAFGRTPRVRASGGALHASPLWAAILADVLDRPLLLPVEHEATSRGAALVALERLEWIGSLHSVPAPPAAASFAPDPERHARYRAAMRRQRALADALDETGPPPLRGGGPTDLTNDLWR